MKVVTYNINGIKARSERLLAYLERTTPDVVCLQEIKSEDATFPRETFTALGYHVETLGQKAYNGVAILSRAKLTDVVRGFGDGEDDTQARFLCARAGDLHVASVYVPNGSAVGSEKYAYKLDWLSRMERFVRARVRPDARWVICGDYNVAPADLDVHDPVAWAGSVLCSEPERAGFRALLGAGLFDAFRAKYPEQVAYTWWDYQMLGFPKNRGLRIDHFLVTKPVLDSAVSVEVDRQERKGKQPSDHAPVVLQLG